MKFINELLLKFELLSVLIDAMETFCEIILDLENDLSGMKEVS